MDGILSAAAAIPSPCLFDFPAPPASTARDMRLLLIGYGYLGQAIARDFREGGWDVVPASLSGGDGSLACDVADAAAVKMLPPADFIIHCAASGRGGPDAYQRVYVDGCRNLTRAFPATPLLFTSSTSVYGQADGSVVTEESPANPDRETGKLLLEAENTTLSAGGTGARLAGLYGPSRARGVFNISDSTPLTQRACYEALSRMFSRPLPPTGPRDLNRKRGWTHKQVSNAKLRATGWQPEFPSFLDAAEEIAPTLDVIPAAED